MLHRRRRGQGLRARFRELYAPYASVASLYLWEIANGAVEGVVEKISFRSDGSGFTSRR